MLNKDALPVRELESTDLKSPRGFAAARDAWILSAMQRTLSGVTSGRIRIRMPSGQTAHIGQPGGTETDIDFASFSLLWRSMRRGTLGFAECYMNEEIKTSNLGDVFRFFLDNFEQLDNAGRGWFKVRAGDRLAHRRRSNTKSGSKRNISAHYDLGNDFYAPWLDDGMTYSSALFTHVDQSLEDAQAAKYQAIMDALDIRPGDRVLEIGCGWGGMAEMLARAGAHVTAITLSREQLRYAKARIKAAGLSDQVEIRFQDYRDVTGTFDRIVSVEMIEAVGEEHWPQYFNTLSERLRPGGHAVLQAITIREDSFEAYRRHPDFIQRYIFPGGMLPTVEAMRENSEGQNCTFETLQQFRHSYSKTLAVWRDRFLAAWPDIRKFGFDERFKRMWIYYLTYCEVGFERGVIDVGFYRVEKRNHS
ncbi:MAG: cyclopropane-fatty-acyl-phospholipid synthase family protein [Pseudomonadota bacterium]